eukprot:350758-Chlamydomonas_euryale.AAC.4
MAAHADLMFPHCCIDSFANFKKPEKLSRGRRRQQALRIVYFVEPGVGGGRAVDAKVWKGGRRGDAVALPAHAARKKGGGKRECGSVEVWECGVGATWMSEAAGRVKSSMLTAGEV